jgi:ATP-binding cassette subfamily B protein
VTAAVATSLEQDDDVRRKATKDGWRLLGRSLRAEWRGIALGVVVGLVWTAAKVAVPKLVQLGIGEGIEEQVPGALGKWSLIILAAGVVAAIFTGTRRYFAFRVSRSVETTLRHRLFAHLQRLHFAFHDKAQTGQLMSRANTDLQQIQFFVVMIPMTFSNLITVIASTAIMISINPLLALVALGALPLVNILAKVFSSKLHPAVMGLQQELAELSDVVEETVSGVRVVKGHGAEPIQATRLAPRPTTSSTAPWRRPASGPRTCRRWSCCPTSASSSCWASVATRSCAATSRSPSSSPSTSTSPCSCGRSARRA